MRFSLRGLIELVTVICFLCVGYETYNTGYRAGRDAIIAEHDTNGYIRYPNRKTVLIPVIDEAHKPRMLSLNVEAYRQLGFAAKMIELGEESFDSPILVENDIVFNRQRYKPRSWVEFQRTGGPYGIQDTYLRVGPFAIINRSINRKYIYGYFELSMPRRFYCTFGHWEFDFE